MNRYRKVFTLLHERNEGAFIPFTVAGDPDISKSETVLKTYVDNGADILEVGYPFSDPIADGPVNQRAAIRALSSGINHASFFGLMKKIRMYDNNIPIGLLLYANTVHHLGYKTFCNAAVDAGIDSLLVADMPPEEYEGLEEAMAHTGLNRVFIVSELTPPDRMGFICDNVDAFVYVVSRLGTTGTGTSLGSSSAPTIKKLKSVTNKPLAVGFGISKPEHVRQVLSSGAQGAIVGSALVKLIEAESRDSTRLKKSLGKFIREFKAATLNNRENYR